MQSWETENCEAHYSAQFFDVMICLQMRKNSTQVLIV